ncbi:MAG: acyl-[acyl-carrier-protein] thioesterase [Prevotellaceae bacterium]|jgi:acyl-ACP thioesterase|nr:acyl-[acyl-carrier-protein] thioesterase [Prevotellaceae bacterium]
MQFEKIGRFNFTIESMLCDFAGKAPLPYLCDMLLKSAGLHADERGFGYEDISRKGKAWVISRIGIYMKRYPLHDEEITVQTWVESVEKYFTRRCFTLFDGAGNEIGCAQSIWAAIDMGTRRPTNIVEMDTSILDYLGTEKTIAANKLEKIPAVDEEALLTYSPKYSDIDINRHFNSVKYIEHILNLFDFQYFENSQVSTFEIAYLSEALASSQLSLHRQEHAPNCFYVEIKNEKNDPVCRASVSFETLHNP